MAPSRTEWTFIPTDSLEKVFADERPRRSDAPLRGFLGENLSAQLAFQPPSSQSLQGLATLKVTVGGPLAAHVSLSMVELVPATLLAFDDHDHGYLRDTPGLYPDVLRPLTDGVVPPAVGYWRALWVDVAVPDESLAGEHTVELVLSDATTGEVVHTHEFSVQIYAAALPDLDIINTHWLHADCLADYYQVEVFSEEHWRAIDSLIESAAKMQVNSVLTPTWTPPLDTGVGHYRTPVQLIGIRERGDGYEFDFDLLGRWVELCAKHGIRSLEIAHLFTQWGAKATPAIYVQTDSGTERRFGWDVPATDASYRALMEQLLPALRAYLAEHWDGEVLFHISDEPRPAMLGDYQAARNVVQDLLAGATIADALSDLEFASTGVVQTPIVATDHVAPFHEAGLNPWVYYCVSQNRDVANRFISMPSVRNRVIGRQIFAAGSPGFLHWGFNFWNTQYSLAHVDPYADTSAGGAFPAGDPSIVYPGPDFQVLPSIRYRVFTQAMDDHRALQLLAELTDVATASSYIDEGGELSFTNFSYDPEHYLSTRGAVDEAILAELAKRSD